MNPEGMVGTATVNKRITSLNCKITKKKEKKPGETKVGIERTRNHIADGGRELGGKRS